MNAYDQVLDATGLSENSQGVKGVVFVLLKILSETESPLGPTAREAVLARLTHYRESGGYREILRVIR